MSDNNQSNNKRIAKNTMFLYIRMILMLAVGLYTSRIVLKVLGVSDFGVYNVMGGVIGMLGYVNALLAGGTSRFLTVGLGENNPAKLKLTFSTTVTLTIITSLLVLLLGETIGLWFVNNHLNIAAERMEAANWVYQCALISSALTITQSPYAASVISHEKMNVFAYMSIFDVVMKLLIVYVLLVFDTDKLELYAILMLGVNFLDILLYRVYCIRNFKECAFSLKFDKVIFKQMFAFSSWNMLGSLSAILMNQGVAIILNIFFGTVVNAAKGVSNQVTNYVQQLYSNFQLAARPQIMKYYVQQKYDEMFALMCNTSKYCGFLLLCIIVPLLVNIEGLLHIWLFEVPDYSVAFIRLTLIYTLFRAIDEPLTSGIHAVGKMKLPNMTTAVINALVFPLTWLICKLGGSPITANVIFVIDAPIVLAIDLWMLKRFINFPIKKFVVQSIVPVVKVLCISLIIPIVILLITPSTPLFALLNSFISFVYVVAVIYFVLPEDLRSKTLTVVKSKLHIK